MKITVLVVPANVVDGSYTQEIEQGDLEAMQSIVGGYIEFTELDRLNASIVSNEEGRLQQLELNFAATSLLYLHSPEQLGHAMLVGTCFIVGQADDEGNSTSVPPMLVKLLVMN